MTNPKQSFVAFFSYVRRNDEHDKGRLTFFRKLLEAELWAQTGKDLQIFQDTEDIEWGDNWKEKITKVLDTSTILIVMVTPGYLESQSCRFEFEYFLNQESRLKRRLILPILYIDTPGLKDKNDEIAVGISQRQWVDWRDIRFAKLTSTTTNRKIASLANQIRDLISDKGSTNSLSIPNSLGSRESTQQQPFNSVTGASSVAELSAKHEVAQPSLQLDTIPKIENFPDDWDTQWQPSFDEAVIATKPEPKFKNKEDEVAHEAVVTSLKSIYVPLAKEEDQKHPPKQIIVDILSSGNVDKDRRLIKTIYGTLISFHGRDRFSFHIFENGGRHLIDFSNDTTRICPELLERLKKLVGEENWRVEEITFQ